MSSHSHAKRARMATLDLVRIAMLTAVSLVLMQFDIPIIAFYKLDFSNVPVLLGAFAMGPVNGLLILLLKNLLDGLLLSQSLGIGQIADFVIVSGLILPAGLIYSKNRTLRGAIKGMIAGTLGMALLGAVMNYYVLIPAYCGELPPFPGFFSREAILNMFSKTIPAITSLEKAMIFVTIPFNLLKGVLISVLTALLYKRVSPLLRKGR